MGATLTIISASRGRLFHLIKLGEIRWQTRFGCNQAAAAQHSPALMSRKNPHNHLILLDNHLILLENK